MTGGHEEWLGKGKDDRYEQGEYRGLNCDSRKLLTDFMRWCHHRTPPQKKKFCVVKLFQIKNNNKKQLQKHKALISKTI